MPIWYTSSDSYRKTHRVLRLAILAAWMALLPAWICNGQTVNASFFYINPETGAPVTVTPNSVITLPGALVGQTVTLNIIAENRDETQWNVTGLQSTTPFVATTQLGSVQPGRSVTITLRFTPRTAGLVTGRMDMTIATGTGPVDITFFLSGRGLTPSFVVSYILAPGGNQVAVDDGGSVAFPPTVVNENTNTTFVITNRGNGEGTVNRITLAGDGFVMSGLPLLPAQVLPDREIRFTIAFSPKVKETLRGSVRIDFANSTSKTIQLQGDGIGASFSYEATIDGRTVPMVPNGTLTIPGTASGSIKTIPVRIRNIGNANGRIATVSVTGAALRITDLPPLPVILTEGQSLNFNIVFTASESGAITGQLRVDGIPFEIAATAIGAKLQLSTVIGGSTTTVAESGVIPFPNTVVGDRSSMLMTISNTGNERGVVNSIIIAGAGFSLQGLTTLPISLDPGQVTELVVVFAPEALGGATGTLQVDTRVYNLRGAGTAPAQLSEISFTAVGDAADPLQQPAVGVRLSEPYPYEVAGKLTLTFASDSFVDDPAIQFSVGGRSVDFRIPANTTEALFGQAGNRIQFQAGTVAGTITLAATFNIGTVSLTPTPAPLKSVVVGASAPRIRNLQIGTRNANGFELLITGYSTTRTLTGMTLQISAAPGGKLETTSLNIDAEAPFSAWYQTAASRAFGSQFTVSVFINVNGRIEDLESINVTARNQSGTSTPATVSLR